MSENRILIIDDEIDVCNFFKRLLHKKGYQVVTATSEKEALIALEDWDFNVAMVDLKLPDTDGLTLLQLIKRAQSSCEVIIMTGFSTIKTAVEAMHLGAFEYIEKPFDNIDEIEALIQNAASHAHKRQNGQIAEEDWAAVAERVGFFVGQSPQMRRLVSLAYKIASKNINVLIQGNTGTGKEVLARFIHAASNRADQPFIAINCCALPENLLESELFGHERGAFTGANQARRGIFELSHRGTLFLDEIGDASPSIQVKLLRVLETGEFCRVGGERTSKTDVRILSATNINLEEAIREKTFREDLFYRLNVVSLISPDLAQRREDIKALAEHFIQQYSANVKLHPKAALALENYAWPGNIRELSNVVRRAIALSDDQSIQIQHLATQLTSDFSTPTTKIICEQPQDLIHQHNPNVLEDFWQHYAKEEHLQSMSASELNQLLLSLRGLENSVVTIMRNKGLKPSQNRILKESEADTIKKTLEENLWNVTATAKALGIARNTLHRKIKLYGLHNP